MATLLTQTYNLNLIPGQNIVVVNAAAYDNSPRLIRFTMFNGAVAADISGWSARVEGTRQGTKAGFSTVCTVASPVVSFAITDAMTASSGKHQAAVVFYQGEERVASATFILNVAPAVLDESTPATEEDTTIYQQWIAANTSQIQTNANDIAVLKGRMDEFASLPPGSTEGNAELVDIRVGAGGETYPTAGDAVRNQITNLKTAFEQIAEYKAPINLFNKNSLLIRNGVRFTANGDYSTLSGSSVSHPIKIDHTKSYCFKYYNSFYGVTANRIVRRCDAQGNLILESPQYFNATNVGTAYGYMSFENRPEWDYFCVLFRTSGLNDMVIAEGETLPSYSDYFEPYYVIKESALPDDLPLPANAQNNILYGKKAAFTGDSICYGAGSTGGYAKLIGESNSMTISNSGQTGATLASGTTVDGVNRGWICQKVGNMPSDYDYYIVEGGVNDAAGDVNVPLGALSSGYMATLDTTTIYGAMESICKTLQTTFLGKKYGFVFPHNCYAMAHRWNTEVRPAMKECLKKWGIPYLDLSEKTAELNNISSLRVYTSNSDGWHPTEEGYRLFYVDKITAWMKTL